MINTFRDKWLLAFFKDDIHHKKIPASIRVALFRKLQIIDDATCDCNQRSKNQPKTSDKNQQVRAKIKQPHPWSIWKKSPCVAAFAWIWIYCRLLLPDMSTFVQSNRPWPGSFVNAVATRESRECAVDSATIYLWLCVSPQDENFQGKSVRPLFLIN